MEEKNGLQKTFDEESGAEASSQHSPAPKKPTTHTRLQRELAVFGSARVLCFAAMLAAMSLILGKFLQIPNPFQQIIRLSFENLPILLAGLTMGPVVGALTGTVADLLGCMLYGYAINPWITFGGAVVGLVAGLVGRALRRPLPRVVLAGALAHLTGSVVIKSVGLAAWYLSSYQMGLAELMLWRLLTYSVIAVAECCILYFLLRHRAFCKMIERMQRK